MTDPEPAPAGLEIGTYDLDEDLLSAVRAEGRTGMRLYRFPGTAVVIGRGGKTELELNIENCLEDNVTVQRRRGGGCAVVLDPGNLVISVALLLPGLGGIHKAYDDLTGWLIEGLARSGIPGVSREGITDLVLGDRKIGGGCIYRERGLLLYSTTLLYDPDIDLTERYLHHPPREPDYRRGRTHREFMTSLAAIDDTEDIEKFRQRLDSLLKQHPWFDNQATFI